MRLRKLFLALAIPGTVLANAAPHFEAASVKQVPGVTANGQSVGGETIAAVPGSLTLRRARPRSCIKWAYDLKEYQITGPAWIGISGGFGPEVARYEIFAKTAPGTPIAEMRLMLRTLLAERFGFAMHLESKEIPAFRLTMVKAGPQLHPAADMEANRTSSDRGKYYYLFSTSMAEFAEWLSSSVGAPVLDATGMPGKFDLSLNESAYFPPGGDDNDYRFATVKAVQEQLGLKLEKRPALIEMLIVDRAEKVPVEN